MDKKRLLLITNIVLALAFVTQVLTVIMLKFFNFEFAYELHEHVGGVLILAVMLHVYLNWAWIKMNILKRS